MMHVFKDFDASFELTMAEMITIASPEHFPT
jgi:hypothetical protein